MFLACGFTFRSCFGESDPEAWGWKLDGTELKPDMTIRLQHQKTSLNLYGVNAHSLSENHVGKTHVYMQEE